MSTLGSVNDFYIGYALDNSLFKIVQNRTKRLEAHEEFG